MAQDDFLWTPRPGSGWDKAYPKAATRWQGDAAHEAKVTNHKPRADASDSVVVASSSIAAFFTAEGDPAAPPPPAPPPPTSEHTKQAAQAIAPIKVRWHLRAPKNASKATPAGAAPELTKEASNEMSLGGGDRLGTTLREPVRLVDPTPAAQQAAWSPPPAGKRVLFKTDTDPEPALDPISDMARRLRDWNEHPGVVTRDVDGQVLAADIASRQRQIQRAEADLSSQGGPTRTFRSPSRPGELPGMQTSDQVKTAQIEQPIIELFADDDARPIVIFDTLERILTDAWEGWEWETIEAELGYMGVRVTAVNVNKILAIKLLLNSDAFWTDVRAFASVVRSFANKIPDWSRIVQLSVHEMAVGVVLAQIIRPAEVDWSDDVKGYIAACAIQGGYLMLPPELLFVDWEFGNELIKRMGDAAFEAQQALEELLVPDLDIEQTSATMPEAIRVQLLRLHRVKYAVQAALEGV